MSRVQQISITIAVSHKINIPSFTDENKFHSIFGQSYMVSLGKLKTDPMATVFLPACQFQLIEHAASSVEFKASPQSYYSSIFFTSNVNDSLAADREHFYKFNKMRLNSEVGVKSLKLFLKVECSKCDKINFLVYFWI